jgi:hypothetical protein
LKRTPITILHESKDSIKDVTETKEIIGGMKHIKASNDSASPSPLFFTEEVVV